jgi:hypothetical protein
MILPEFLLCFEHVERFNEIDQLGGDEFSKRRHAIVPILLVY